MKTIDEIWQIVEESSNETAFNKGEVEGLYKYLSLLSKNSKVVEIGVEYGRSTSVIGELQKEIGFSAVVVDNWCQDNGQEAKANIERQIIKHGWDIVLVSNDSDIAASLYKNPIDLIHIDGDHTYEGVKTDCEAWLPKVKKGGIICFDDYGHPGLEGVKKAADEYFKKNQNYKKIGLYGNKLGVFKKIRSGA